MGGDGLEGQVFVEGRQRGIDYGGPDDREP